MISNGCHFVHVSVCLTIILTLRPRRNVCHFVDDIFKWIFFIENKWISIKLPLKFVPKDQISNIPSLVQIMAWHRPGNKPLSEPMGLVYWCTVSLGLNELLCLYHKEISKGLMYQTFRTSVITVISSPPSAAYMPGWIGLALVQIMACCLDGAKPLSEPMRAYC